MPTRLACICQNSMESICCWPIGRQERAIDGGVKERGKVARWESPNERVKRRIIGEHIPWWERGKWQNERSKSRVVLSRVLLDWPNHFFSRFPEESDGWREERMRKRGSQERVNRNKQAEGAHIGQSWVQKASAEKTWRRAEMIARKRRSEQVESAQVIGRRKRSCHQLSRVNQKTETQEAE